MRFLQVTNDILTQIMSRYTLNAKKIAKIESYIAKKELQNEKGLDKYIEKNSYRINKPFFYCIVKDYAI